MDKSKLITYEIFKPFHRVIAFTTSKETMKHSAPRFTGDSPSIYVKNRITLSGVLGIIPEMFIFPRQTHSCSIEKVAGIPENEFTDTDALITSEKGICICVQTADCVPILLYDPQKHVSAAIHSGWRGTVGRIAELTVNRLGKEFGSIPENILAAIGPSICYEKYEIGEDVVDEVTKKLPFATDVLTLDNGSKFHLNLWEANRQLLINSGLKTENIEVLAECSFQRNYRYYSARRDGIDTGRMVSGIMLS